jgi:hypothetical protein
MTDLQNPDAEIAAIAAISSALSKLADSEARRRVLSYVLARYLPEGNAVSVQPSALSAPPASSMAPSPVAVIEQRELPGVALLTDSGDLRIMARDLKAKSGLDAGVRLAHIAIYAHERLTGKPLSSRKGLTPLLKEWRLYDGNVRARLAKERGIIRNDDSLSLDAHARRDAERYVEEILNDELHGQWKP